MEIYHNSKSLKRKKLFFIFLINYLILFFIFNNLFSLQFPAGFDYATHFFFIKSILENFKNFQFPLWSDLWYAGFPISSTLLFPYIITSILFLFSPLSKIVTFNLLNLILLFFIPLLVYWTARKFGFNRIISSISSLIFSITPAFTRLNIFGQYTSTFSLIFLLIFIGSFYKVLFKREKKYFFISVISLTIIFISHLLTSLTAIIYMFTCFLFLILVDKKSNKNYTKNFLIILILSFLLSLPFLFDLIKSSFYYTAQGIIVHPTRELILEPYIFVLWILRPLGYFQLVSAFAVLGLFFCKKIRKSFFGLTFLDFIFFLFLLIILFNIKSLTFLELLGLIGLILFFSFTLKKIKKIGNNVILLLFLFFIIFIFGLGPKLWIAKLLPFSNWLTYDRFILHASIFGSFITAWLLYFSYKTLSKKLYFFLPLIFIALLSFLSFYYIFNSFGKYCGSQETIPQKIIEYFRKDETFGRYILINCPFGWVETTPLLFKKPTIDGGYNSGRLLPVLRESGIERINDLQYYNNYEVVNHFLANSKMYGIKWIIGCSDLENLNLKDFKKDLSYGKIKILKNVNNITFLEWNNTKASLFYERTKEEINISVKAKENFSLIIKEAYHPYWQAELGNKSFKIEKNEFGLMKLDLPKGNYTLKLIFNSSSSKILFILSLIYFLLFLFISFFTYKSWFL